MIPWRRLYWLAVACWGIDPERFWDMTPAQLTLLADEASDQHQRSQQ